MHPSFRKTFHFAVSQITRTMYNQAKTSISNCAGYTLIEVLVVVGIVAILAALLLPALAKTKTKGDQTGCMNNLRQLSVACLMYASDSEGRLAASWPLKDPLDEDEQVNRYCWCPGLASTKPHSSKYGPAPEYTCTNEFALKQGIIWPYVKSTLAYRCSADKRMVKGIPIVRSYSMNSWISGRAFGDPTGDSNFSTPEKDATLTYTFFRKESQMSRPSQIWNLIEEDESSINDGMFVVDMSSENREHDIPSNRHGSTYEISFADGHMEAIKWAADRSAWLGHSQNEDWLKIKNCTTDKP